MKRHSPDTIAATIILLLCGAASLTLSRRWGMDGSLPRQMVAVMGPIGLVLAVGMAVHGVAMPPTNISHPARIWGVVGSLAAIVNLWSLGYFAQGVGVGRTIRLLMPVVLVLAWFLPSRFYGEEAVATTSREVVH